MTDLERMVAVYLRFADQDRLTTDPGALRGVGVEPRNDGTRGLRRRRGVRRADTVLLAGSLPESLDRLGLHDLTRRLGDKVGIHSWTQGAGEQLRVLLDMRGPPPLAAAPRPPARPARRRR